MSPPAVCTVPLFLIAWLLCLTAQAADVKGTAPLPASAAAKISDAAWRRAEAGEGLDLIVLLESGEIENAARIERLRRDLKKEDAVIMARKAEGYRRIKEGLRTAMPAEYEVLRDYSHLPMAMFRFRDSASLSRFLARGEVREVYADEKLYPHLGESLPLVGQPAAAAIVGRRGEGTAVAVLDTGVDYTKSAFGCTAPGTPATTCKVIHAEDIAPDDGSRDDNGHGTNVAGIASGVAPDAKIVALDIFDGASANSSDVIAAINRVLQLRGSPTYYNIVAINLSLGSTTKYTSACSNKGINPYRTPIINARAAGVLTIASSGNSGWTDGIAMPACTPEAVSVGAVYDADVGSRTWVTNNPGSGASCTDSATAADKVTCFSNNAGFMTLFAPGALISAAGATYGGTSQAAPHVAGAVAALQGAYPGETAIQTSTRLTGNGTSVTDTRNGIAHPRLNLAAAFDPGPTNDLFAGASTLSGQSGQTTGSNLNATREVGEPAHAGDAGGRSVWWRWTAPAAGELSLDTLGSGFDTLLAVYTGATVGGLATVSANDDNGNPGGTSGLAFNASAGTTYRIAVDGKAGAAGAVSLNWSLRQAQAISFPPIADTPALSDIPLSASSSSGLAVSLASTTPSVCAVAGNTGSLLAGGTCVIVAHQAGDAAWLPAPAASQSFLVTRIGQVIDFPAVADRHLGAAPFNVTATASSGLPVALASLTADKCAVGNGTVTLLAGGTCILQASQAGNEVYEAAAAVENSFNVLAATGEEGDVPLPPWSLLLLGSGLYAMVLRRGRDA